MLIYAITTWKFLSKNAYLIFRQLQKKKMIFFFLLRVLTVDAIKETLGPTAPLPHPLYT